MALSATSARAAVKADVNVTPLIDVMLVLLIIFMVVTPIIASGFQAQMPQGKHIEKREEQDSDITFGIDKQGKYYLNAKPIAKDKVEQTLRDAYAARATDKILYFKADKELPYAQVEDAIRLARKAGVRVLAAVSEQPKEGKLFGRGK